MKIIPVNFVFYVMESGVSDAYIHVQIICTTTFVGSPSLILLAPLSPPSFLSFPSVFPLLFFQKKRKGDTEELMTT